MRAHNNSKYGKALLAVEALALLAALGFGMALAVDGLFNTASYYTPVFDNSMLWAARARIIYETGGYAETEIVFGGVTKTYHVPFWPAMAAGFSSLSGLDLYWSVRAIALVQIVLLGLATYLLAKKISGSGTAGAVAAFLAYNSLNLMTWGTRTTPISWGVILIAFGLWAVAEERKWLALLAAVALALDHPPSLLVFTLSLLIFVVASHAKKVPEIVSLAARGAARKVLEKIDLTPVLAGSAAFLSYMAWHVRQTGFSCLDFKCLPQLAAREFGKNVGMAQYLGKFPQAVGGLGLAAAAVWWLRGEATHKRVAAGVGLAAIAAGAQANNALAIFAGLVLILYSLASLRLQLLFASWLSACLVLSNNDAFGIGVFTERFLTHLDQALAVAGGMVFAVAAEVIEAGIAGREKNS